MKYQVVYAGPVPIGVGEVQSEGIGVCYRMLCNAVLPQEETKHTQKKIRQVIKDMQLICNALNRAK